jgi:hypothetical protein
MLKRRYAAHHIAVKYTFNWVTIQHPSGEVIGGFSKTLRNYVKARQECQENAYVIRAQG